MADFEEFFSSLAQKLAEEDKRFTDSIEIKYKELNYDMYDCMSKCYLFPGTLALSRACGKNCTGRIETVTKEITKSTSSIKNTLGECLNSCKDQHDGSVEAIKSCSYDCFENAISKFKLMNENVQGLLRSLSK